MRLNLHREPSRNPVAKLPAHEAFAEIPRARRLAKLPRDSVKKVCPSTPSTVLEDALDLPVGDVVDKRFNVWVR
jgi:hypothetical protein